MPGAASPTPNRWPARSPMPRAPRRRSAALRATAERAQAALAEVRAEAATHARAVAADKQRAEAAKAEQADWRAGAAEADTRHGDFGRRVAEAEAEAQRLAEAPDTLDAQIEAMTGESVAAAEAAQAAAAHERAGEEALRGAEARLAEAGEAQAAAREARAGAAARAEAQDARRAEMARISGEKFECPPPLLPETAGFKEDTIVTVEMESGRLDRQLAERERIGPVNLVAESELNELEESRLASQAEREELGVAINRLRGSIGSLNREGRARLLAAFQDGRPPFPQPLHHPVRGRPGASRAGRIGRSARGRPRDHGAAARQAPLRR